MKIVQYTAVAAFILGLITIVFVGIPWYIHHDPMLPWWLKTALYLILVGILVVLLTVMMEQRKVAPGVLEDVLPDEERPAVFLNNMSEVPGREVSETLGLAKGHIIFAVSLGKDLSALMRLIPGGELVEYTDMMGQAREAAIDRMLLEAQDLGADAVLNVRFVTTSVVTGAAELLAYGTAVRFRSSADDESQRTASASR